MINAGTPSPEPVHTPPPAAPQSMPTGQLVQDYRDLLWIQARKPDAARALRIDRLEEEILRRMAW